MSDTWNGKACSNSDCDCYSEEEFYNVRFGRWQKICHYCGDELWVVDNNEPNDSECYYDYPGDNSTYGVLCDHNEPPMY